MKITVHDRRPMNNDFAILNRDFETGQGLSNGASHRREGSVYSYDGCAFRETVALVNGNAQGARAARDSRWHRRASNSDKPEVRGRSLLCSRQLHRVKSEKLRYQHTRCRPDALERLRYVARNSGANTVGDCGFVMRRTPH